MDHGMEKKLPIGVECFKDIVKEGFYYVDKTGLVRELLHRWAKVTLFTRPRRFGKSLNMDMLKSFFETGTDKSIFDGLEIAGETALCDKYMGKFPVISISLKGVGGGSFETARTMMAAEIRREAGRFPFLADSGRLTEYDKQDYSALFGTAGRQEEAMADSVLMNSILVLSRLLRKHYGREVIILLDEYDVPLAQAFEKGYYDSMAALIRQMFLQALKTNDSLYFAVLTGCLRISKESIFTGLNNLKVLSVLDVQFDEYFGFTDREVRELLAYYDVPEAYGAVKEWYDGYHFGNVDVYCPWDVICHCDRLRADKDAQPQAYWANTSSNEVVKRLVAKAGAGNVRREIETLVAGEAVRKEVRQDLTYKELYDSVNNIWSVLFTTGYLTHREKPEGDMLKLFIPNREIRKIFTGQIMAYFEETVRKDGELLDAFCEALKNGDAESVERRFHFYLKKTISIRDTSVRRDRKENFYHGILLGLLGFKESWGVFSNRESGDGYSDIMVEIEEEDGSSGSVSIGIVIEMKYSEEGDLEADCRKALAQIAEKHYEERLREEGMEKIIKYGIACFKKRCKVIAEAQCH